MLVNNRMNYASIDDRPIFFQKEFEANYDQGNGIPTMQKDNVTIQDMYKTPFLFLQDHHRDYKGVVATALKGIQCTSELSKTFFSYQNIQRIQRNIKKTVFDKTMGKYRLDVDQDFDELTIIMRAVFIEYGRYLPTQIVRQVKKLNDRVVQEVVPDIIVNIKQYYGYLADITTRPTPIPLPVNVSNAGRRTLPSITTTFESMFDI